MKINKWSPLLNRDNFMKNRLSYAGVMIFIVFALLKNQAIGLGLGEIEVKSALNQPFDAVIQLNDTNGLTEEEIIVDLASKKDFERIGIDRFFFLLDLKFGIYIESDNSGVIHITTKEPIDEPYLDFIVETQWPTGRLLREYTVLIDPPVFLEKPVAANEAPVSTPQGASVAPVKSVATPEPTQSRTSSGSQHALVAEDGYIKTTDETLWEVALKARPSSDYSVQQTMLAIQDQNPRAFMRGNINLIQQHQKIKVPSPEQIRSRSLNQANQEVAFQNKMFSEGRRMPNDPKKAPLIASQQNTDEMNQAGSDKSQGELKLVSSEGSNTDQTSGGLESGAADDTNPETLRNALTISEENLEKSKEENLDLSTRLAALEENLETMQKLLTLKDEQMALLTNELDSPNADTAELDATIEAGVVDAAQDPAADAMTDTSPDMSEHDEVSIVEEDIVEEESAVVTEVESAPAAPVGVDGLIAQVKENIYLWTAGLGLILVILFFLFKPKSKDNEDETSFGEFDGDMPLTDDDFNQEGLEDISGFEDADDFNDDILPEETDSEETASGFVDTKDEVKAETSDVIAEADIYLAYGRAQPAIDILTTAIHGEPERTDLRVKLLEVYADQNDHTSFDLGLAQLAELGNDEASQQAAELRTRMVVDDESNEEADELVFDMLVNEEPTEAPETNIDLGGSIGDQIESAPGISSLEKSISEHESQDEENIGEIDFDIDMDDFDLGSNDDLLTDFDLSSESDESVSADDEDDADLDSINVEMRIEAEAIVARLQEQDIISGSEEDSVSVSAEGTNDLTLEIADHDAASETNDGSSAQVVDDDMDSPLGVDESETKIDLARAYIEMEDFEGAQELLKEVIQEGSSDQKSTAEQLISDIS